MQDHHSSHMSKALLRVTIDFYQEENEVKGGCQGSRVLSEWRTSEWDFSLAEFDGGSKEI